MVDLEEGESSGNSEGWKTGKGTSTGRREAGRATDRNDYVSRSVRSLEAGEGLIVSEERGQDVSFTSKGRSSEGYKRVVQSWGRRD